MVSDTVIVALISSLVPAIASVLVNRRENSKTRDAVNEDGEKTRSALTEKKTNLPGSPDAPVRSPASDPVDGDREIDRRPPGWEP